MREAIAFTIIALLSIVLVGCAMQKEWPGRDKSDTVVQTADSSLPDQDVSAEESVEEMGKALAQIDELDDDLAELDGLEDELDLDLG